MTKKNLIAQLTLFVLACLAAGGSLAQGVTDTALANAGTDNQQWLTYGRDQGEQRYSPLDQINDSNVASLGVAWTFDTGSYRGLEATPLVANGILYATRPWSSVFAVNARTGELIWDYDPQVDRSIGWRACCDVVNRGVALYANMVYVGTIDGRLIAIDANTGQPVWEVQTVDPNRPYTITGAPRIADGKVIIGNGGAELGSRGYVTAYDARTGEQAWRFWVVPGNPADGFENPDMEFAATTWDGNWWEVGGGGNSWDSMIYDSELRLVYVGTGNGSPWSHEIRSNGVGDNLYLSSIVALNVDTGRVVWHYQTTPGDNWDYTAVQPLMLADLAINGVLRKVILQAPKNGFFYVLDRQTGDLLYADAYAEINWATGVDLETGRPMETPHARYDTSITMIIPGPWGAHNWHPMSFNPNTGLVYIPANQGGPFPYAIMEDYEYVPEGWNLGIKFGSFEGIPTRPENEYVGGAGPRTRSPGALLAWDPVRRQPRWQYDYDFTINGGTLSTGGNLVFQGGADGVFRVFAADDGELLFDADLGVGIMAAPVTYQLDGVQYVAVLAGWGGSMGLFGPNYDGAYKPEGRLWTFRLNGSDIVPVEGQQKPPLTAIPFDNDAARLADGYDKYMANCGLCHGAEGVSGGPIADLRYASQSTYDSIQSIVREGAYTGLGMPNLGHQVSADDVESIKNWILSKRAEAMQQ
jgi:PQQ-dependent dehydrogenase (methanol/ethanol family)